MILFCIQGERKSPRFENENNTAGTGKICNTRDIRIPPYIHMRITTACFILYCVRPYIIIIIFIIIVYRRPPFE